MFTVKSVGLEIFKAELFLCHDITTKFRELMRFRDLPYNFFKTEQVTLGTEREG